MSCELQSAFLAMLPVFVAALKATPPMFPPTLRVKRVQMNRSASKAMYSSRARRDRSESSSAPAPRSGCKRTCVRFRPERMQCSTLEKTVAEGLSAVLTGGTRVMRL